MTEPHMTFRTLLQPMTADEFFTHAYGKLAVHIPGHPQKFADIFSWEEFNRLLNQSTLWSERSMKMVLNGDDLEPKEFCRPGRTREGNQAMLPDPKRVTVYLQQGATLVLDLVERLSPRIAALAASLEMVLGNLAACNVYCSWHARQGFSSHFDGTDVFALHIEGEKTWRLYEGRFQDPVHGSGFEYAGLPPEQHASARGKLLKEVRMKPGDVLYIPRGQYHDAIAGSEASLHLTFGLVPRTGHDFMTVLLPSLYADPLFRQALPHFDDAQAYDAQLRRLADRLHEIMTDVETGRQAREDQRKRVLRDSLRQFALPARDPVAVYRVRWRQAKLKVQGDNAVLLAVSGEHPLTLAEAHVVQWAMERDYFNVSDLANEFPSATSADVSALMQRLLTIGFIESLD
ncbi:MAG: cupin domain-containing protein [Acidiferrobacterales bacterium]|nr:cupin domain-containing protein [Acidiferrobacterales bacterium]